MKNQDFATEAVGARADCFSTGERNSYCYRGILQDATTFVEKKQLMRPELWRRFVQQFREEGIDSTNVGWRGEYWGKMMRGASFVYAYTRNEELYRILEQTVCDMMDSADADGRISTYHRAHELCGWDLWCRKYVLLGMQYFLEICREDALKKRLTESMCRQADYIIQRIGNGEGKIPITRASGYWRGLNSSSLLEPIVRLYVLTGEEKYYDFAAHIVDRGGTDVENLFRLAYEDKLLPYQYPVTKAYEMISCFEGLLEFYRVSGVAWYREAVIRFSRRILESDFTVIGSSGCTHELFDHSFVRQANTTNGKVMQETCVTVTLMKFFWELNRLTGDASYADAFERSLYNAYLGALNTEDVIEPTLPTIYPDAVPEPLPFDSYSPLTAGTRGNMIGGLQLMSDRHYYGCCACIGSAGIGLVPKMQLLSCADGFVMNLYIAGTATACLPDGTAVSFRTETEYPTDGKIRIRVGLEKKTSFRLLLRNPAWSRNTSLRVGDLTVTAGAGYAVIDREWSDGDEIELLLDMRTEILRPVSYGSQVLMNKVDWENDYVVPTYDAEDPEARFHVALRRGPLMLAQEARLGHSPDDAVEIAADADGYAVVTLPEQDAAPYQHILEACVQLKNGNKMTVTDYASAGKTLSKESRMAVWMRTRD